MSSSVLCLTDASLTDEDNSPLPGAIIGYLKDVDGGVDRMEAYDKVSCDCVMTC